MKKISFLSALLLLTFFYFKGSALFASNGLNKEEKPIGLILDLFVKGRAVSGASSVTACTDVTYTNYDWTGFKVVENTSSGNFNFFEFTASVSGSDDLGSIGTVIGGVDIVSMYNGTEAPVTLPGNVFSIIDKNGASTDTFVGNITVTFDPTNHTIKFCTSSWNSNYTFTMLTKV